MADAASRQEWIKRVLGVDLPAAGSAAGPRAKLMPVWTDAKEAVDSGIDKLQQALRAADDDDLRQIAEFGLFGATQGQTVRLMAALREADSGRDGALPKVRDAVQDYRDFLDAAPIVDLIEDNPFGVSVPLRKMLGAALAELERLAG
jgi:hypothetical protein